MFQSVFGILSGLIFIADLTVAYFSFLQKTSEGRWLACTCIFTALLDLIYMHSITVTDYTARSVLFSLVFLSVDMLLMCLVPFTALFTRNSRFTIKSGFYRLLYLLSAVDAFFLIINPFSEIYFGFMQIDKPFVMNWYVAKPLFFYHILFTVGMVCLVSTMIIRKMSNIPREYRITYWYVEFTIIIFFGMSILNMYFPDHLLLKTLDPCIIGYSSMIVMMYYAAFVFRKHGLLNKFKSSIFDNIIQGIVLFDFGDALILKNEVASSLLPNVNFHEDLRMNDFLKQIGIEDNVGMTDDAFSVQCYGDNTMKTPVICNYRLIKNKDNDTVGKMFVFIDATQEVDLLTGFHAWENFKSYVGHNPDMHPERMKITVLDINRLSITNTIYGFSAGNKQIKELSELMKEYFPNGSYFVRGSDAHLIVITFYLTDAQIESVIKIISEQFSGSFQYSIGEVDSPEYDTVAAIQVTENALRTKKLLDKESNHSETLSSLIRALQQCDEDTEQHVLRTQELGKKLGRRIGLSNIEQGNLSLLCILHDIGKIGIPLEILNKPGKLSNEEWDTIKSHTEKGYQIAMSNKDLSHIAETIKYHHERWDGQGYPDGLSRESIPLLSRIIAVVDAFDAMINDRHYRKARNVSYAIRELLKNAGTQFDPYIVSEFVQMLQEDGINIQTEFNLETADDKQHENNPEKTEDKVHAIDRAHYILDENNCIIEIDDMFTTLTGYTIEDVLSIKLKQMDLLPEEDVTEYMIEVSRQLAANSYAYIEHRLKKKNGSWIYVFCYGRLYFDAGVMANRSEIIVADISDTYSIRNMMHIEKKKAQVRLEHWEKKYRQDDLTGLLTHSAFMSDLEEVLLKGKKKILFLMMDVDKFKEYNDTYGHRMGDEFLLVVSQSILASLRKNDLACRMGGDEFAAAMFFDSNVNNETIRERAKQLFNHVSVTVKAIPGGEGVSMGAAISTEQTKSFNDMYEEADKAMYESKEQGRGKLVIR